MYNVNIIRSIRKMVKGMCHRKMSHPFFSYKLLPFSFTLLRLAVSIFITRFRYYIKSAFLKILRS